jgi:hypothetical protein
MVPGKTGHMVWCCGDISTDDVAADAGPWFSSDGAVTWTRIPGIYEPEDVVFGAPAVGGIHPVLAPTAIPRSARTPRAGSMPASTSTRRMSPGQRGR